MLVQVVMLLIVHQIQRGMGLCVHQMAVAYLPVVLQHPPLLTVLSLETQLVTEKLHMQLQIVQVLDRRVVQILAQPMLVKPVLHLQTLAGRRTLVLFNVMVLAPHLLHQKLVVGLAV